METQQSPMRRRSPTPLVVNPQEENREELRNDNNPNQSQKKEEIQLAYLPAHTLHEPALKEVLLANRVCLHIPNVFKVRISSAPAGQTLLID